MSVGSTNLLWKDFKGIRKLHSINSDKMLGADICHNVRLSKEKSGEMRSIRSSGWYKPFAVVGSATCTQTTGSGLTNILIDRVKFSEKVSPSLSDTLVFAYDGDKWVDGDSNEVDLAEYGISFVGTPVATDALTTTYSFENVIRLFSANCSGYSAPDQLVAFTKTDTAINAWVIYDNTGNSGQTQIATFTNPATDVTDVCMTQWGDRLGIIVAFGTDKLGFIYYSADAVIGGTQMGASGWYYRTIDLSGVTTPLTEVTSVRPYRSRLAVNGVTTYVAPDPQDPSSPAREMIYGVWFSEAGNPLNFTSDPMESASETSAFYVETGEKVNKLEEYHGLTAFCRNRSYNITGTSQNDSRVLPLTAKGVFGNATFTMNGKCGYVDSWAHNIFTLRDNIDGTIGFDDPVGGDIQDYLTDIENVTVNSVGRRVRVLKESGQSLVFDVDIQEWTEEQFPSNARAVTFLNTEYFCCGGEEVYTITERDIGIVQEPNDEGYYSHYRTNLIWLDSQSSVKSHLYPIAIILEPNTVNKFHIKFTTDRGDTFESSITKANFENVAIYSNDDTPADGSFFVSDDEDYDGKVFFAKGATELLVTADRPPFWRYLQIDIYTTSPDEQFNISGIEAKNTIITNEMLEY
jgi:hypothetical protein